MKRLKTILQSKSFFFISLILLTFYVLIFTKIIGYNSKYSEDTTEIIGEVVDYKNDGDKLSLIIKDKEKVQVSYYFKTLEEKENFKNKIELGIKVKVIGSISKPLNNTIPNTFNYKEYLYNKKIYNIFNASSIEIIDNKVSLLIDIKNWIVERIDSFSNTSSYMQAFILGDKDYIDSDVYQTFRVNGVTHLFAVSGMHISFLVVALVGILSKLKLKEKYIQGIIITFLFFYMFLIGFSASVVRASLLYILMLLNKKFNFNINSLVVLYLLFMALIIINPFYVYDLGFIYSFLTSFGLILFHNKIKGNYFVQLLLVSLVATIFSLPVTLYNFYKFNLLSILNNLIIVPLVSLILFPFTLITFIIPFLEPILIIGFKILEFISIFTSKYSINIVVPKINILFIILYYGVIFLIFKYGLKNIIILGIIITFYKLIPYFDNNSYVYFLDVGQGDATLIITEHRRDVILVDTGGIIEYSKEDWQIRNSNFRLSNNIVNFIHSLGISKLDLIIITHGDMDHLGYAKEIEEKIEIDKLMLNNNADNALEQELNALIKKRIFNNYNSVNINITNLNSNVEKDENNSSLVLYIEMRNNNLLLMGDAPKKIENGILKKYNLNASILKVGHHGSSTSSSEEFVNTINPKYSIISAGRNNRYGHPNNEVLEILINSKIYRTDIDGSILFKIKNNKSEIETCVP